MSGLGRAGTAADWTPTHLSGKLAAVAVYTRIDEGTARAVLSTVAPDARFVGFTPMPHGSINTTYRIDRADGAPLYLRINEGKPRAAIEREALLVRSLASARLGAATPTLRGGPNGEVIHALAVGGGRLAVVFDALPGDDLPRAEVSPAHTAQIGAFMARAHGALRRLPGRASNPYSVDVVRGWLGDLARFEPLAEVVARLARTHAAASARRRPLPRTVIHGDLFVDNTKWRRTENADLLAAVFDWEMAGRDARMRDLMIAVLAWCVSPRAMDESAAAALVDGYRLIAPLHPSERRGLFSEAILAAIRFAASRIRDFEVRTGGERAFLDYKEFLGRLDVLEGMGERAFVRALGVT